MGEICLVAGEVDDLACDYSGAFTDLSVDWICEVFLCLCSIFDDETEPDILGIVWVGADPFECEV